MQEIFKITISSMDLSQPEQIILQVGLNLTGVGTDRAK